MDWMLLVPLVACMLLAAAGWTMAWSYLRHFQHVRDLYAAACAERRLLYAQNADLREAVQEHLAQVGTLTIELKEARALPKARVKTYGVPVKRVEDVQ